MSSIAYDALGSANSALSLINSVSLIAYTSYNNGLGLSETVTGVKQDLSKQIAVWIQLWALYMCSIQVLLMQAWW